MFLKSGARYHTGHTTTYTPSYLKYPLTSRSLFTIRPILVLCQEEAKLTEKPMRIKSLVLVVLK